MTGQLGFGLNHIARLTVFGGSNDSFRYLLGFLALVVILGIIFVTMTVRSLGKQQTKKRGKHAKRSVERYDAEPIAPAPTHRRGPSPLQSQADNAYREALRRTHLGEALPSLQEPPKRLQDDAYRDALRQWQVSRRAQEKAPEENTNTTE